MNPTLNKRTYLTKLNCYYLNSKQPNKREINKLIL